jgi:alcohol dehydrogenase class IV
MLLPAVTAYSRAGAPERYAEAARRIGFAGAADGDDAAGVKLLAGLAGWNRDLAVPSPGAFGIDPAAWEAKLGLMAEQALASGSPANNPRVPDAGEIVALYRAVWSGAPVNF